LNPLKHIDAVGTILLPAIGLYYGGWIFGWAKPTPVNPSNFRRPVLDDVLTSVAGPASNFILAFGAVAGLALISLSSSSGQEIVRGAPFGATGSDSVLVPVARFLFQLLLINVVLAVFNLIPVPPLDGSHVFRHLLSGWLLMIYDRIGIFGLVMLVALDSRIHLLSRLFSPFLRFLWGLVLRFR
ncbi:MAG TPA: site-2 protease family protein, partial [Terriglobales bacterium]|nr:site-2 protease family protein [Terriglobales bacterium]